MPVSKLDYTPDYMRGANVGHIKDRTFWEDVGDEFWLTWMGQMIENELTDRGYYSEHIDENFNPYDPEYIRGYERYATHFIDARNQEEADHIKSVIDRNNARRERLELGGRDLMPGIVANLGDPINFVPIPFVKGMSLIKRVAVGGTAAGGLIGATEPIRRSYDPTSTNLESAMYIGSGFFFGGLFSGILGKGGPDLKARADINPEKLGDNYYAAFETTESGIDWSRPFTKKFWANEPEVKFKVGPTRTYIDKNGKYMNYKEYLLSNANTIPAVSSRISSNVINLDRKKITRRQKNYADFNKTEAYAPVVYKRVGDGAEVIVDSSYLKWKFRNKQHIDSNKTLRPNTVPPEIAILMKNENDYISYLVKKEIWRHKYVKPRHAGESLYDFEFRLNEKIHKDTLKQINADFSTDVGNVSFNKEILAMLDNFTDSGGVTQAFPKDHPQLSSYMGRKIFELVGDYGVQTRSGDVRMPTSAYLETQTRWEIGLQDVLSTIEQAFVEYRSGIKESNFLSGINLTAMNLRRKDTLHKLKGKLFGKYEMPKMTKNSWEDFNKQIYDVVSDTSDKLYTDPNMHPSIKKSVDAVRRFFKEYADEAEEVGLFANKENINAKVSANTDLLKAIKQEIKGKNAYQKKRLLAIQKRIEQRIKQLKKQAEEITDKIQQPFSMNKNYITRYFDRDKILADPGRFKKILEDWYTSHPLPKAKGTIKDRVEETYEKILDQTAHYDHDELLAMGKNIKGQFVAGTRPLMQRDLNIPTDLLEDFVIKDLTNIMRMYKSRMSTAIEITRRFGDRHMEDFINRLDLDITLKTVKSSKDNTKANMILRHFEDAKDKMYGTFNTQDPTSLNKRIASFIKNWTSLTSMGRVVYTAQADIGRPFMTHGLSRMWNHLLEPMITNKEVYLKMQKELQFLSPFAEITQQAGAMERFSGTGLGTNPSTGSFIDKWLFSPIQKAQGPWYWMNGLTQWTMMMKRFTGYVSQSRFIEDSIKFVDGDLSEEAIKRLGSYGIDKNIATIIKRMPWERQGDVYLPNARAWSRTANGRQALQIYRQAIKADIERTIITPSPNDKTNMMYGVIRVDDADRAKIFDNAVGRWLGFQQTRYGGAKFQNAFMSLPFQFYSWMIAANRKLLMSGSSGRDFHLVQGATAMVMFAIWGDFLKDPAFWYRKSTSEKWLAGVEKSGVLAIYGDMNHIIETISQGDLGIRPAFDMKDPYGDPDSLDILRPFMGAAPFNIINAISAYDSGSPKEQKDAIRRMIPLNNWLVWDRAFKKVYNSAVDY